MNRRNNLRNIAIIAHVDHGKTTLVDAMLRQSLVNRNIDALGERIMDSMDLERERGITIKSKNASIEYKDVKINIVDTPGHADFGGEVERILQMVDGALLLIDAKEGPMPQTRFVLRKAIQLGIPAIVVVNKIDRPNADFDDVVNRTFDLFVELEAGDDQLDFPVVYTSALTGTATLDPSRESDSLAPLLDTIIASIPSPEVIHDHPLQLLVLALHYDQYKGQMGIGKVLAGSVGKGDPIVQIKPDGAQIPGKVTGLMEFEGLQRKEVDRAEAGEIVAVAGLPDVKIGDTITDPANPIGLPAVKIDEPTVRMTFGVNTSPFSGLDGTHVTSQRLKERLWKEMETNVALRVQETGSRDTFLVSGRGELHLAILIETMRREGYEMQVSQPEVILKRENGATLEPYEHLSIDIPSDYQGVIMEEVGARGAELLVVIPMGTAEIHMEYAIPTRGVIGLKTELMTSTRGHVIMHHVFDQYKPVDGPLTLGPPHGSLIAAAPGSSTAYALDNAQERGSLFIGPGLAVYMGMVIGQSARDQDLDINVCKAKNLTNMRAAGADAAINLTPPKPLTLEYALEYIGADELVEVTPKSIRLRKKILDSSQRKRPPKV